MEIYTLMKVTAILLVIRAHRRFFLSFFVLALAGLLWFMSL